MLSLSNANTPRPINRHWECSQGDVLSLPESCRCIARTSLVEYRNQSSGLTENRSYPCFRPEDLMGPPVLDPTPNLFGGSAVFESALNAAKVILAAFRVSHDVFMFDEA